MSKDLRNGMKVQYLKDPVHGYVHAVDHTGFSVRYEDERSFKYDWYAEDFFTVLSAPPSKVTDHDHIAQTLTVKRLTRDFVEELLANYREGLALDLEEIADDRATTERYRPGMQMAANRLRKAGDRP